MSVKIGSARINERGAATGGAKGDQKQKLSKDGHDYVGEVSQQDFYVHKLGWEVLRASSPEYAIGIASSMIDACDNLNIGYGQDSREEIIKNGTTTTKKTHADCGTLVRRCVIEGTGTDPGNFTTANEADILMKTGLFSRHTYREGTVLYTGDILVTKKKGHTVIVTVGAPRGIKLEEVYPRYIGDSCSIVEALAFVGEKDTSFNHRREIAIINGIVGYKGTAYQNTTLLNKLKLGNLKKA